jgi:hypothetical protein
VERFLKREEGKLRARTLRKDYARFNWDIGARLVDGFEFWAKDGEESNFNAEDDGVENEGGNESGGTRALCVGGVDRRPGERK